MADSGRHVISSVAPAPNASICCWKNLNPCGAAKTAGFAPTWQV